MRPLRHLLLAAAIWVLSAVPEAAACSDPRAVLTRAIEVAGGEAWLSPGSLILEGTAEFYAPDKAAPVSRADDYRMWRKMDPNRASAHAADGKVRILAQSGGRRLFEVGFDGATTWNEKGVVPEVEAAAFWSANFGFGIIRHALNDGFRLECAPERSVGGHPVDLVRVIDPNGQPTLFGIDRERGYIRYMGFATPRGWHERTYDDFVRLKRPNWLQAREVTLFYNGVRANTVRWRKVVVGAPIDDAVFAPPAAGGPK
jgi:hypothetical protein